MKVILFDGICNLCNSTVLFIIKRDRKALFRFAALQSVTGQELLREYPTKDEQNTTICYIRDNRCYRKSTAILYILRDLGRGWQFFYPLILVPACVRDAIYMFVSNNRYRLFGKKPACMIPDKKISERFI